MTLLLFIIGYAPLVCIGALAVRLLQGSSTVLSRMECLLYGSIAGPSMVMILMFMLSAFGSVPVNLEGMLLSFTLLAIPLAVLGWKRKMSLRSIILCTSGAKRRMQETASACKRMGWMGIAGVLLALWITLKLASGITLLMMDPAYNDDVFNNWNYRAKVIMHEEQLALALPHNPDTIAGVSTYPPTVPLLKIWIALVSGGWNDRMIALASPLWYLLALAMVWGTIKRSAGNGWALVGLYLISSLPLLLMHGSTPYADLFVALHIAVALLPLLHALQTTDVQARAVWLRIGALGTALLAMTKNEALLMHLPPILLLATAIIILSVAKKTLTIKESLRAALWYVGLLAIVLGPWLAYKYMNGLAFGNAKPIDTEFALQPGALRSLGITWVLEANFLLLPGLLIALLCARWRTAFTSPVAMLSLYVITVIAGLAAIFSLTGLSTEALRQTGSARGIIQLLPVIVILVTLLLRDWWNVFGKNT